MDDDRRVLEAIASAIEAVQNNRLVQFDPYRWQREYLAAGEHHKFRLTLAGNQTGKTLTTCAEDALHLTGRYDDLVDFEWKGRRFEHPTMGWICSITSETSRDILQLELLGDPIGTGLIPKDDIQDITYRQAGIGNVVDKVWVRNRFSKKKPSVGQFKAYDQGWRKFQGVSKLDFVHLDEEPDENNIKEARIPTEIMTRLVARPKGIMYCSLTPLLGETALIRSMQDAVGKGAFIITAGWDDSPHLTEEAKTALKAQYPDYELDARTKGVPLLGSGRIFMFAEDDIKEPPFEIPRHFARVTGIDFGQNHPNGTVGLAVDRDNDVWHVYFTRRQTNETPMSHVIAINSIGGRGKSQWIPVAWPHDGLNRESDGRQLADKYIDAGANLMTMSARENDDIGGKQPTEPMVMEFNERAKTGRLKVFATCWEFFDEMRSYHRDERGNIVAVRDDVLKAAMYAGMMVRYATPDYSPTYRSAYSAPMLAGR